MRLAGSLISMMGAVSMAIDDSETEELLRRVGRDDVSAIGRLLERYRRPLRRLIAGRLDGRLAARFDPSDIVQEALANAGPRLPEYVRERPMPYYSWLRRLALDRLAQLRRFHLGMSKRSVNREHPQRLASSDRSAETLIDRLADKGMSPSGHAIRNEKREQVKAALDGLTSADRRILELRYLEDLPFAGIAAELGIGLGAVKMRHLRALERFRGLLVDSITEED
jgi:RNA polymerase sigma-70 factor, ECF subfamily